MNNCKKQSQWINAGSTCTMYMYCQYNSLMEKMKSQKYIDWYTNTPEN
jgi:hypothetical protein